MFIVRSVCIIDGFGKGTESEPAQVDLLTLIFPSGNEPRASSPVERFLKTTDEVESDPLIRCQFVWLRVYA